jgi:hypothetical protein
MSAQVSITQLPAAGAITGTESVPIVQNGVTVQTTTAALAGSPVQTYSYLTVSQTPQLANSRYVGVTNGLVITDGGAQGLFNISTTGALLSLVNSSTGFQVKTSSTAITNRSIAVSGSGLAIANGSGVSGDPTISLSGQTSNFANASFNGLVTLSTAGAITSSVITGTASQIDVANGSGVGGNPTISISSNPTLPGSAGVLLPFGTTGQRSGSPTNGTLRYNTTTALLEAYLNGVWTSLASGSGVTSISTGTGLTGGPITSTGTISIDVTGVVAASYTNANITVNAQGQITSASNGTAGTVTSVAMSVPAFLSVAGSPITSSGTLAVTLSGTALPIANGGTGQTTASAAFNALSPMTTAGDTIYGGTSGAGTRLGIGTAGQVLTVNTGATAPQWSTLSGVAVTTFSGGTTGFTPSSATSGAITLAGTLVVSNGGTGLTTLATGSLTYGAGTSAYNTLAIGTANQILTVNSGATAPQWSTLSGVAVTTINFGTTGLTPATATSGAITVAGTLAIANGGTAATTAATARTNLVAAKSGTNSDITELYALNGTSYGVAYQNAGNQLIMGSALTFDGSMLFVPGGISGGTF